MSCDSWNDSTVKMSKIRVRSVQSNMAAPGHMKQLIQGETRSQYKLDARKNGAAMTLSRQDLDLIWKKEWDLGGPRRVVKKFRSANM